MTTILKLHIPEIIEGLAYHKKLKLSLLSIHMIENYSLNKHRNTKSFEMKVLEFEKIKNSFELINEQSNILKDLNEYFLSKKCKNIDTCILVENIFNILDKKSFESIKTQIMYSSINLWKILLNNNTKLVVNNKDSEVLNYLKGINFQFKLDTNNINSNKLIFYFEFKPNKFFKQNMLVKEYIVSFYKGHFIVNNSSFTAINWFSIKENPIYFTEKENNEELIIKNSFFNLFTKESYLAFNKSLNLNSNNFNLELDILLEIQNKRPS
jgi:hypothetical protein